MAKYTVKSGDSLAKIAGIVYGDQRMMQALSDYNGGVMNLKAGMVLNLPDMPQDVVVTNQFVTKANAQQQAADAASGQSNKLMAYSPTVEAALGNPAQAGKTVASGTQVGGTGVPQTFTAPQTAGSFVNGHFVPGLKMSNALNTTSLRGPASTLGGSYGGYGNPLPGATPPTPPVANKFRTNPHNANEPTGAVPTAGLPGYQDWQPQTLQQASGTTTWGPNGPIANFVNNWTPIGWAGRIARDLNNGALQPKGLNPPSGPFQNPLMTGGTTPSTVTTAQTPTPMAFQYQFQAPNAQQFASAVQQALQYNQNGVASGDLASVLPHVVPANAVGAFTADQMTTYGYIQNPATGQWLLSGTQGGNTQNPGTFTAAQVQGMVDEALGTYVPYYHDQNALNPLGTSAGGGGGGEVTFAPTGKWAINDAVMSMRVSK
jgi:hypothetical protein